MTKFALLICLFYATAFTVTYNAMQYNTIRIAYYGNDEDLGNGLVDEFLQKAKDNKYNYENDYRTPYEQPLRLSVRRSVVPTG